ncbi:hypothetical protein AWZ03_012104 [Drosophila navojoa]|uniref:Uncharacterized protein n=2 Tax=Drosophila navojoa TaxID=7232 RepID=A0A484B083_DRONA|nr:hypothetical protein AWZ03_012104 [Drosophila navojoa]
MPKSKSYDDDDGAVTAGNSTSGSATATTGKQQQQQQQAGAGGLPSGQGNQNSGWFGGLWNKFSLKPKNQMILPDDKNPTIVWDKERKCWTNTEGNADEAESFKPPPKMSDMGATPAPALNSLGNVPTPMAAPNLLPQQSMTAPELSNNANVYENQGEYDYGSGYQETMYAGAPAAAEIPTMPAPAASPAPPVPTATAAAAGAGAATVPGGAQPKLQSNMFKIKRNRTLKNSYVDVFNPSGAPISAAPQNVLAPAMAPVAVPQGGFFVPGAMPMQQQQQPQQQQQAQQQQQQ